jgi:hypothetical protein
MPLDVMEHEDGPEFFRKLLDRLVQRPGQALFMPVIDGLFLFPLDFAEGDRMSLPAPPAAKIGVAGVEGDAVHPGDKGLIPDDFPEMRENLNKNVLEEVFGGQAVKSVPIGQVKKGPLVMLVNLFHGSFISPLAFLDENREGG